MTPNLPNIQSIAQQSRSLLTTLTQAHQQATMLLALATAQDVVGNLNDLPDGTGGTISDPAQPVPVLDGLSTNQLTAALDALDAFNAFMTTTPPDGTAPVQTALSIIRL